MKSLSNRCFVNVHRRIHARSIFCFRYRFTTQAEAKAFIVFSMACRAQDPCSRRGYFYERTEWYWFSRFAPWGQQPPHNAQNDRQSRVNSPQSLILNFAKSDVMCQVMIYKNYFYCQHAPLLKHKRSSTSLVVHTIKR